MDTDCGADWPGQWSELTCGIDQVKIRPAHGRGSVRGAPDRCLVRTTVCLCASIFPPNLCEPTSPSKLIKHSEPPGHTASKQVLPWLRNDEKPFLDSCCQDDVDRKWTTRFTQQRGSIDGGATRSSWSVLFAALPLARSVVGCPGGTL